MKKLIEIVLKLFELEITYNSRYYTSRSPRLSVVKSLSEWLELLVVSSSSMLCDLILADMSSTLIFAEGVIPVV